MKILCVSIYPEKGQKHANIGGVASYTKNLVSNFPRTDEDEIFVLCNRINAQNDSYLEDGIKAIRCFDRNPNFFWQILKEIHRIKPDVIHFQQEIALFGSILTAYMLQWLLFLLRGYNLIITLHGVVSLKKINKEFIRENNSTLPIWAVKMGFRVIYNPLCLWAKKIIVHEEVFKTILIKEYGVSDEKIEVIHHGVEDLSSIEKEAACGKLVLDAKKNLILFMGYLTGYKGIDLLLEGFSWYAKTNPRAYLVVGSGKHPKLKDNSEYNQEYKRLQLKAKELIPENQYRWDGFIEEKDIINYYSACDVSIYPYTVGMSSSGPMAFAVGYEKPFLASDVFNGVVPEKLLFEGAPIHFAKKLEDFFIRPNDFFNLIKGMKNVRLWSKVGLSTMAVYHSLH